MPATKPERPTEASAGRAASPGARGDPAAVRVTASRPPGGRASAPGMLPPGVTDYSPAFSLPMRYLLLGLVGFAVFAGDLLIQSLRGFQGGLFGAAGIALTHLLTLGSLLSFVMGAVYQLESVAFLIPIASEQAAKWNFWLYSLSTAGLAASMAAWWNPGLLLFGAAATISIGGYAGIVSASLKKAPNRDAMFRFVRSAHVYLPLAVTVGWLLIVAPRVPGLRNWIEALLVTHIVLAAGGFFTFLIIGFSFKLLPMFTLSHGFSVRLRDWTFGFAHAAIWLIILGAWTHVAPVTVLGGIAGLATFALHLFHLREILAKRLRKKIEPTLRAVIVAGAAGLIGSAGFILAPGIRSPKVWAGVAALYLLGWLTLTVMGYAYKIVPFLIWTRRYSQRAGKEKVPLIGDLISPEQPRPVLWAFAVGLVVLTAGIAWMQSWAAAAGGTVVSLALGVFCFHLLTVVDLGKIGREMRGND
ncbi:hypothetical protein [Kyrpidia spormannii]|uniref:Uncharacterized protein n=1 Tax=Kyrpidia spormannii TaxID=2055160 RepID=A0ACA8Z6N6_9BACL|nr:hypothetical protein [Kyrpidia spormannii]CAB3390443.1 conserved membrane protein of unknown function [Kyrpidia spormannii]